MGTKIGDGGTYAIKILDKNHTKRTQNTQRAITEKKILQKVYNDIVAVRNPFSDPVLTLY
jgi:hypothetical protein